MNQEKFNLKWQTHTDHVREMLCSMMISEELTDVTIVSEDKIQFKAHRVVLSACSPFFQDIIKGNLLAKFFGKLLLWQTSIVRIPDPFTNS